MAHQAGAYPGFSSMKRLGVFLLPPGWDASPSQGYPQYQIRWYPFIHLGGERHCESKVSCPRTQHNVPGQGSNPECCVSTHTKMLTREKFCKQKQQNTHLFSLLVYDFDGKFMSVHRQIQKFFVMLICSTYFLALVQYFFSSGTFIITKLGSSSLTEIVLKIVVANKMQLQVHLYFAAKDFTLHNPRFCATFFALCSLLRVTGNTKLNYWQQSRQ